MIDDFDSLLNKGDAIIVIGVHSETKERITQLIMCCPNCGQKSSSRGNHIYNRETQTYTPSIIHDTKYGGCGWHGWLTNGIFKDC